MVLQAVIPVLILLVGVVIIGGAFMSTSNPGEEMQRRIGMVVPAPAQQDVVAAKDEIAPKAGRFDLWAQGLFAAGAEHQWGMQSRGVVLLLTAAVAGLAEMLFTFRVVQLQWWYSIPAGLATAYLLPRWMLLRQQRRAEARFTDLFPDAVDSIVRMLRAGLPMTSAVRAVGAEGSPPVSTVFAMVADQVKIGIPIEEALSASSEKINLVDFRFFSVAVLLQYSTGGNIASTLEILSTIIRKRRAMRMKAQSATAEIRMSAYVLGALPFMTIGALMLIQPNYLAPLFSDPRGHMILAMAAGGLLASFVSMHLMMRTVTKG